MTKGRKNKCRKLKKTALGTKGRKDKGLKALNVEKKKGRKGKRSKRQLSKGKKVENTKTITFKTIWRRTTAPNDKRSEGQKIKRKKKHLKAKTLK